MGRNSILDSETFRLFADGLQITLVTGVASLLDFTEQDSRQLYNYDRTNEEADKNSIRADWKQTGNDLKEVMHTYATVENSC